MKLVLVKWVDAVTMGHGWRSQDEIAKTQPTLCQSVGWVLKQTKQKLILVSTIEGDDCDGDTTIPMGMVKEIVPLKREALLSTKKKRRKP